MKRHIMITAIVTALVCLCAACGQSSEQTVQYQEIAGLDQLAISTFQTIKTEAAGSSPARTLTAEIESDETPEEMQLTYSTDVYNKPQKSASVIGTLKSGTTIHVYGESENGKWSKISYNGRIAYIPVDDDSAVVIRDTTSTDDEDIRETAAAAEPRTAAQVQTEESQEQTSESTADSQEASESAESIETSGGEQVTEPETQPAVTPAETETQAPAVETPAETQPAETADNTPSIPEETQEVTAPAESEAPVTPSDDTPSGGDSAGSEGTDDNGAEQ